MTFNGVISWCSSPGSEAETASLETPSTEPEQEELLKECSKTPDEEDSFL